MHYNKCTRGGVDDPRLPTTMKLLSCNSRGLGSPDAVRSFLRLLRNKNPDLVFLMETRLKH